MRRQTAEHRRAAIIRNHKKSRNIIKPDKKSLLSAIIKYHN